MVATMVATAKTLPDAAGVEPNPYTVAMGYLLNLTTAEAALGELRIAYRAARDAGNTALMEAISGLAHDMKVSAGLARA